MLTDLDIGMNDWVVPRLHVGRRLRAGPRRVLTDEELEKHVRVLPLLATEDELRRRAHAARRRTRRARTSSAARGTTSSAATPRSRRVPGGDGPPEAEARGRGDARARPVIERRERRRDRRRHGRRLRPRGARGARAARPTPGIAADFMRVRGFPVRRRRCETSSTSTSSASSSSRTATRSCARSSPSRPASAPRRCTPVLAYGGFPLSAPVRRRIAS